MYLHIHICICTQKTLPTSPLNSRVSIITILPTGLVSGEYKSTARPTRPKRLRQRQSRDGRCPWNLTLSWTPTRSQYQLIKYKKKYKSRLLLVVLFCIIKGHLYKTGLIPLVSIKITAISTFILKILKRNKKLDKHSCIKFIVHFDLTGHN